MYLYWRCWIIEWAQYLFANIKFTRDTNMPFPKIYIDDTFICSYLTYRVSIIRHTLLILTHVRLPKHPDSLFCHRVLPRNFTSAVHVCSTSRKIIRKRERERGGGGRESEYLVWHTTLTHPAYVLVSWRIEQRWGSQQTPRMGRQRGDSGDVSAEIQTLYEYSNIRVLTSHFNLIFHLIIFDISDPLCCLFNLYLIT